MTEPITIGVDHGYAAMKTAHCSFPSGLAEYAKPEGNEQCAVFMAA